MSGAKTIETITTSEINLFDLNLPYTFKCQHCPFFSSDQNTVSQHYQIAHCEPVNVVTVGSQPEPKNQQLLQCDHCDYTTLKRGNLNAHLSQMHVANQRPYPCPHCDYRAKTERHLQAHIPTHGGEAPPFKCNFCAFESADRTILVRHKQEVHESDKVFSCEQCTYKARTSDYLAKHKVTQHTPLDERQFQCAHCSKKFAIESLLRRHLKKHLDNTRHNCIHCGNAFKDIRRHRSRCTKAPEKDLTRPSPKDEPSEPKPPAKSRSRKQPDNRDHHSSAAAANSNSSEVVSVPQLVQMPSGIDLGSMLSLQGSLKGVALNSMIGMNQSPLLLGSPLMSSVRVLNLDVEGVSVQTT